MEENKTMEEIKVFNFRIIDTNDGNQIIDRNLQTPENALTPTQLVEYNEMEAQLYFMDRTKRKMKEEERKRRMTKSFFHRLACACGMI